MKNLLNILLIVGALLPLSFNCHGQVNDVIQQVASDGDFEGINSTTTILKVLGLPAGVTAINLSSAASIGRRLTIINYSSVDLPLTPYVRVDGTITALIASISPSPNIMDPLQAGVNITITYDGTNWIKI